MSINVTREPPRPVVSEFPVCKHCGFIHPIPVDGICPNAQAKTIAANEYGDLIKRITMELTGDAIRKELLAEMLEKTIKAWKIQVNKEVRDSLSSR